MALDNWVKLPTDWINEGGLTRLRWGGSSIGADNIAALMTLIVIAHHADRTSGIAKLTYDALCRASSLSRAKASCGLSVLEGGNLIEREPFGRSTYMLKSYSNTGGWAKLPARNLYNHDRISAFSELTLRRPVELHAIKLYLLFIARRGNDTNMAHISYDKITEYTAIERNNIKSGISLLAALGLVHVEHVPSTTSQFGISNGYRVAHIEPFSHMGTRGRGMSAADV